ncbi:M23 family metallopeptidase [Maricaulaceae bacterium MS644]
MILDLVFAAVLAAILTAGAQGMSASQADPVAELITDINADGEAAVDTSADAMAETAPIRCAGVHRQGAALICRAAPGAQVALGDVSVTAGPEGWVVIGHDRDAAAETTLSVREGGSVWEQVVAVEQREYDIQRIEGIPQQYVSPPPETLERIRAEGRRKAAAYTSLWETPGFAEGFTVPVENARITGVYGSQRYFNSEPRRPHYGLDYAAPAGTPVTAPAPGVVTLADADMYYEGGLIFIDHGQGFISGFLHLSEVDVAVGDVVARGDRIGAIGAGGRSTGAHLDWRIKWRGRYIDPAEVLQVQASYLR